MTTTTTPVDRPQRTLVPRPGGKSWLGSVLRSEIAKRPHQTYVEPFAGALGAFNAREEPSRAEVINDLDEELINLFRQVRRHPEELQRIIGSVPSSRAEHARHRLSVPGTLTEIERAARYWYLCRFGFGGGVSSFGTSRQGPPSDLDRGLEDLRVWSRRLAGVVIERLPWHECVARYDAPATLFFLDPPYLGGDAKAYAPWRLEDLQGLAQALAKAEADWILTIDDTPAARALFSGRPMRRAVRQRSLCNTASRRLQAENKAELVICRDSGHTG